MNQIKDSSRSITSPAGTADAMETLAPVALDSARMRAVLEREGGCIVWGGAAELSPADEIPAPRDAPLATLLAVSANTLAKAAGALAGGIQCAVRVGGSLLLVVLAMWLPFWLAYQPAFFAATTRS